jgi:transcriptional regulator with XRE-family HTH domain
MKIGERLRELREKRNLSQGEIEEKTGLLRCYISRVENGHTVPGVETLGKLARALEIPVYKLFRNSEEPVTLSSSLERKNGNEWGSKGKEARLLAQFSRLFGNMKKDDLKLLFHMARKLAKKEKAGGREARSIPQRHAGLG